MPFVTDLKPQKSKKRMNVYLDGKFSFGIDLDNLVLSNIKIGSEFNDQQIAEIIKKAEYQKTWDKLLRFAMHRPRSEKEITDYFRRKEVAPSLFPKLLKRLKQLNLLEDFEFAKWWVEQRNSFKPKPKRILSNELKIKGIASEIIAEVLEDNPVNEEKIARDLLSKKEYKWKSLEPKIRKLKITQYLAGKGFDWEIIDKLLRKV